MNLSVVGGRATGIGVGGLTLGGGISFLSGRHGWACDGVVNCELVTARGEILHVNHASYPDLYWALRGGGNNFGIVIRFDMETFSQGSMWGGSLLFYGTANTSLLSALVDFADNAPADPDAAAYVAYAWDQSSGLYFVNTEVTYAKPIANPPILQNLASVPFPSLLSTLRLSNMTDLARELNQSDPDGFFESYWTITFKSDLRILQTAVDIFVNELASLKNVFGIVPAIVLQPITGMLSATLPRMEAIVLVSAPKMVRSSSST